MLILFKLIVYVFCAYGITIIMISGRGPFGICETIRNLAAQISDGLGTLFSCPLCFSTWVGFLFSLVDIIFLKSAVFTPANIIFSDGGGFWMAFFKVVIDMAFTSGSVWLIYRLDDMTERVGNYSEFFTELEEEEDEDGEDAA